MRQRASLKRWFPNGSPATAGSLKADDPTGKQRTAGSFVSRRTLVAFFAGVACMFFLQTTALQTIRRKEILVPTPDYRPVKVNSVTSLRHSTLQQQEQDECQFYFAESAIPNGGLGVFTATGLLPGDMAGFPELCIMMSDSPKKWTHMRSHTWGRNFFGQSEGSNSRAHCGGFATVFNNYPDNMINVEFVPSVLQTNAGQHRATSPGAGGVSHHFGFYAEALNAITAGSELLVYYGDWDFDENKKYPKLERPVSWLKERGWCADNIRITQSTIPYAGRGAFANRALRKGEVVAPAPLQSFKDRKIFNEQLFINYCLQPKDSKMIFYPYGPGVNLINHSSQKPNVELQWSTNHMHHADWLKLSYDDFWDVTTPGGIILDFVAIRDIEPGEEILVNYGSDWETAWKEHVANWKPPEGAEDYVYPAEMDETEPLRTVKEQKTNPYPENLVTVCSDEKQDEGRHYSVGEWSPARSFCHILERHKGRNGEPVYTVSMIYSHNPKKLFYDASVPKKDLYIVENLPREAIRFVERPYVDDEHLPGAFRHPIELPDHLVPEAWKNDKTDIS